MRACLRHRSLLCRGKREGTGPHLPVPVAGLQEHALAPAIQLRPFREETHLPELARCLLTQRGCRGIPRQPRLPDTSASLTRSWKPCQRKTCLFPITVLVLYCSCSCSCTANPPQDQGSVAANSSACQPQDVAVPKSSGPLGFQGGLETADVRDSINA